MAQARSRAGPAQSPCGCATKQAAPEAAPRPVAAPPPRRQIAIGRHDAPEEREADRAADRVTAGLHGPVMPRRGASTILRRACAECEEEKLHRKGDGPAPGHAPAAVHNLLARPGAPLPASVRAPMERGFGRDFSAVRIHTDSAAAHATRAVDARAWSVGSHIAFGEGRFRPGTPAGDRLIAHELAHVAQTDSAPTLLRRDGEEGGENASACHPDSPTDLNAHRGQALTTPGSFHGVRVDYYIWETLRAGDTNDSYYRRAFERWVDWRYGSRAPELRQEAVRLLLQIPMAPGSSVSRGRPGCNYAVGIDNDVLARVGRILGVVAERRVDILPGEAERTSDSARVNVNWAVMAGNAPLSRQYLLDMEHFAEMPITDRMREMAADGLDEAEVTEIVGANGRYNAFTSRFTQAWGEYQAAGGSDVPAFGYLVDRLLEQLRWRNHNAGANLLEIGKGDGAGTWVPAEREILGIRHRRSHLLLYDAAATPLRSITGQMFRDEAYVAAEPSSIGFNIATIRDPVLRGMLNMLRQQVGDPNRVVLHAAAVAFRNVDRVSAKVAEGLDDEVIERFEDALPLFAAFLGGHALSVLLTRSGHPVLMSIGAALRLLLEAAGYIMEIDFTAGALARILEAAQPLSRVQENPDGTLTDLSLDYLEQAAVPLRGVVADIAMMATLAGFGRLMKVLHRVARERIRIECTVCNITAVAGEARSAAEVIGRSRELPREDGIRALEAEVTTRRTELGAMEARENALAREIARLGDERASSRGEARDRLSRRIDRLHRQREALRSQQRQLGSSTGEIGAELARLRNPNPGRNLPCFLAGTPVLTPDGPVPIEALRVGDPVLAANERTGEPAVRAIVALHHGEAVATRAITVADATIHATLRHRFHMGGAWVDASDLSVGDLLTTLTGGTARIDAIEDREHAPLPTYNLSVDVDPTYHVGPGLLVHNDEIPDFGFGPHLVYEGHNPAFPNEVYIGQTNDRAYRESSHRAEARAELRRADLSPAERRFWEFKANMELRVRVRGLNPAQADYMEQLNFEIEVRARGRGNVMNRVEIATPERFRELERAIRADPRVREARYC